MYVNPFSEDLTELGSNEFPLKDLSVPLLVVQNFMQFLEIDLIIYIVENSEVYIPSDLGYFVNMGSVTITTYSLIPKEADMATIRIVSGYVPSLSPKSKFVLLSDLTPNLVGIASDARISTEERTELEQNLVGFHVLGTGFSMTKVNLESDVADQNFIMFLPIRVEDKIVKFQNSSVLSYGGILKTSTPLNLDFQDLSIEYSMLSYGISIDID